MTRRIQIFRLGAAALLAPFMTLGPGLIPGLIPGPIPGLTLGQTSAAWAQSSWPSSWPALSLPSLSLGSPGALVPDLSGAFRLDRRIEANPPTLNHYGLPGAIDMPTAEMLPDGEVAVSVSYAGASLRNTLAFQMTPWLTGAFRYTGVDSLNLAGFIDTFYYDRSFDIHMRLLKEGDVLPALSLGLRDFVGTGLYSGEYLVATKSITPRLKLTAGLGWGRLSETGTRPNVTGTGGTANIGQWFTGPMSPFGAVEWRPTDRLGVKLEYSSDSYQLETTQGVIQQKSPWNVGVDYKLSERVRLGASYTYGTDLGVHAQIVFNPKRAATPLFMPAPVPVAVRPSPAAQPQAWSEDWAQSPAAQPQIVALLAPELDKEGVVIETLSASANRIEIRFRNTRYQALPNALGRIARILTEQLPPSIEIFRLVPMQDGLPLSAVTFRRSDLEAIEYSPDPAPEASLLAVTGVTEAGPTPAGAFENPTLYPRFNWRIGPYLTPSYFDPDSPVRIDTGIQARASYDIAPGLSLSGSVRKRIIGNKADSNRLSNSQLPPVRTDAVLYARQGDPALERLMLDYRFRPGKTLYARMTVGYFEDMYGGLTGEVLWKPATSPLAMGVEVNYVAKRDFDLMLGFQDYRVATGHASLYYDFGKGYLGQIDAGRYLAGDWGATFRLSREFANGWKIGAFATLTDVPFAVFGEGSFDKGIELTIPMGWLIGKPTRAKTSTTIRPITRDGGARVSVPGRLYGDVRQAHLDGLEPSWGRVWK